VSKKLLSTAALVCCFMLCMAAAIADITGTWKGTANGPDGQPIDLTYNIKGDGDKLTGTGEANGNTVSLDEGKVAGNEITFKVTNSDGVIIPHKGRYFPEGDSISMNLDFNGMAFHVQLKRQK